MNFSEYQTRARKTAIYPFQHSLYGASYVGLGICGEAGEVAEKVKKAIRDDNEITDLRREEVSKELGDVLWYLSNVADEFDLDLEVIALNNIVKLESRKARGKIHGSGDDR